MWCRFFRPLEESASIQSIICDYILVDVGNGQKRRAYVETYLPSSGNHFLAFCDDRGGDMQLKITEDNYQVLDDKQAAILTRDQARSKVCGTVRDIDNVFAQETEEDLPTKRAVKANRSAKRSPLDDEGADYEPEEDADNTEAFESRSNKRCPSRHTGHMDSYVKREPTSDGEDEESGRRAKKKGGRQKRRWTASPASRGRRSSQKILGKSAGSKLLSRCITVV